MSDWQPPDGQHQMGVHPVPEGYPAPDQMPAGAVPPVAYPPVQGAQPAGAAAPKKKTGLIAAAIVVVALLLICCCGAGVAGLLFLRTAESDVTPALHPDVFTEPAEDPTADARAAEWQKVAEAYVASPDAEYAAPDERQTRLANDAIAQLLPDFQIEELKVDPGYVRDDGDFTFDGYAMLLVLESDPEVKTAFYLDVATPEADAYGIKAENLDLGEGQDKITLEGKTWVLYPAQSKKPLLGGISDQSYVELMRLAAEQWPDALPSELLAQDDGSVLLKFESWDSYCYSDTYDRIEAYYTRDGDGWVLGEFTSVIEPKEGQPEAQGTQI